MAQSPKERSPTGLQPSDNLMDRLKRVYRGSAKEKREYLLRRTIEEYKTRPHTPELITRTWQVVWQTWREQGKLDIDITVAPCDRTQEELVRLEKERGMMIYVPSQLATQGSRHLLAKIFPPIQGDSVKEGNSVTNENPCAGWLDIEASLDAPNRIATEEDLGRRFLSNEKEGQNLTDYIIGSEFSKLTTGHFFDEETSSRLLGSRRGGRVVTACFSAHGHLAIYWHYYPQARHPLLGGRSKGVKKT